MSHESRIASLQTRHAALAAQIVAEEQRPRPDTEKLNKLKVDKLHLKEEIERMRVAVQPA